MQFEPKQLDDGSLQIDITLSPAELEQLGSTDGEMVPLSAGRTYYCVTCKNNKKFTIEADGDLDANVQAAATCMKETFDPSYSLAPGRCA